MTHHETGSTPIRSARTAQRVFAIDDDPLVLNLMRLALEGDGHRVDCFATGEEFLRQRPDDAVGCVIIDLHLPGVSGVEIQQRLREADSDWAVIVVSGGANVATAVQVMQNGAVTLLEKPYTLDVLRAAVQHGLARSQEAVFRRTTRNSLRARLGSLTADERQVLDAMVAGISNKVIAQNLVLGMRTVERHRSSVLRKMEVGSVAELASLMSSLD
jgi:two-component system response regulator FixJ